MECPFLRDTRVRSCGASSFRKMIVEAASDSSSERCSSSKWVDCPAASARSTNAQRAAAGTSCPFVRESEVEFCSAAPVQQFIPASTALLSRCKSDGHLYCELYLVHADPAGSRRPRTGGNANGAMPLVDGIPVPQHLAYAPNHMWLDVAEDGVCHVGIDGFLARVLGSVDSVTFVANRKNGCPVAVLNVHGVDLQMVFPNALQRASANLYLRTTPEKIAEDPYGAGWLFEAYVPPLAVNGEALRAGLIPGDRAVTWMRSEAERLNEFVHECASRPGPDGVSYVADGGRVGPGIASHLEREDLITLFNEFFAPQSSWRRSG